MKKRRDYNLCLCVQGFSTNGYGECQRCWAVLASLAQPSKSILYIHVSHLIFGVRQLLKNSLPLTSGRNLCVCDSGVVCGCRCGKAQQHRQ